LFRDGAGKQRCHSDDDNTREGCGRPDREIASRTGELDDGEQRKAALVTHGRQLVQA